MAMKTTTVNFFNFNIWLEYIITSSFYIVNSNDMKTESVVLDVRCCHKTLWKAIELGYHGNARTNVLGSVDHVVWVF